MVNFNSFKSRHFSTLQNLSDKENPSPLSYSIYNIIKIAKNQYTEEVASPSKLIVYLRQIIYKCNLKIFYKLFQSAFYMPFIWPKK